jgi:GNAT superfamily N-acetyltransferase
LLQSEARLHQALLQAGSAAVDSGSLEARRSRLRDTTAAVVVAGRGAARRAAIETLQPQIELAAEVNPSLPPWFEVTAEGFSYDQLRAVAVAQSFSGRWVGKAAALLEAGAAPDDAATQGFEQLVKRLEVIAATESAEAFDQQRQDDLDAYGRGLPYQTEVQREFAAVPFKWWNAVLDKLTCRTCSVAHGKIVLLGQPFPEGRPGGVHPNCRCVADIVLLPAWYRRYERAIEAAA